jgi:hypothetical protein
MCTGWFENRTEGELARAGGCVNNDGFFIPFKNALVSAWEECAEFFRLLPVFALLGGLSQHYMVYTRAFISHNFVVLRELSTTVWNI